MVMVTGWRRIGSSLLRSSPCWFFSLLRSFSASSDKRCILGLAGVWWSYCTRYAYRTFGSSSYFDITEAMKCFMLYVFVLIHPSNSQGSGSFTVGGLLKCGTPLHLFQPKHNFVIYKSLPSLPYVSLSCGKLCTFMRSRLTVESILLRNFRFFSEACSAQVSEKN